MALTEPDEPSEWRRLLRALPRKRVALVLLVVLVNACIVTWWRGCMIGRDRWLAQQGTIFGFVTIQCPFVGPWEWTTDEWRETWPWAPKTSLTRTMPARLPEDVSIVRSGE